MEKIIVIFIVVLIKVVVLFAIGYTNNNSKISDYELYGEENYDKYVNDN
jgi:hypothetical protein